LPRTCYQCFFVALAARPEAYAHFLSPDRFCGCFVALRLCGAGRGSRWPHCTLHDLPRSLRRALCGPSAPSAKLPITSSSSRPSPAPYSQFFLPPHPSQPYLVPKPHATTRKYYPDNLTFPLFASDVICLAGESQGDRTFNHNLSSPGHPPLPPEYKLSAASTG
jgi:hypothetical protein